MTRTVTRACFIRGPLITASAGLGFDSVLKFGAELSFQPRMVSPRLDAGFLGISLGAGLAQVEILNSSKIGSCCVENCSFPLKSR